MGARTARKIVIALIVLAALLLAADRIGNYVAERSAADTIQSSQHLRSRPGVDIGGFPFLTQLAAGSFDRITVTAKDVAIGQQPHLLDISRVQVVLHQLTVSRDFSRVHASTATATATITYAALGHTLGVAVGYAGNGRIKASKPLAVGTTTVRPTLTTRPALVDGHLAFTATAIDGAGGLGGAVVSTLQRVFDLAIPLQAIPFRIHVTSLRVEAGGIVIDLAGSDLTYAK